VDKHCHIECFTERTERIERFRIPRIESWLKLEAGSWKLDTNANRLRT
jgi:hypothetical protein